MADNRDNKPIVIMLVIVLVAIVGVIAYFVTTSEPEPQVVEKIEIPEVVEPVKSEPVPDPKPEPPAAPVIEAPVEEEKPDFVLPLLDNSDQLIRDGAVSLSRHEGVNAWVAPNQLIRKFVAFTDNVARGQVAKEPIRSLAPEGPFLVQKRDEKTFLLDPASYSRYTPFVEVAGSVDARRAAEFYHLLRPLVQIAYAELGYANQNFDDVMFQAIGRLLETPIITGEIRLIQPVVMYKFEDPKLESLSAAQKQLIRMGPRNTIALRAKISEIALELRAILDR
ncbi:MAG: DUF3014 domain-containing protein [Gammaproteobacteria bacterium]|nr:DUF3014 domain-containing protein [Gammaproteobacteria bacterium]MBT5154930.1 DUF3014 domain-containing protein [Gammaproteobacteria bacterium]MBT5686716.1 DUF3014 domain-containing protein [Gammaproteobacteria bacterium]